MDSGRRKTTRHDYGRLDALGFTEEASNESQEEGKGERHVDEKQDGVRSENSGMESGEESNGDHVSIYDDLEDETNKLDQATNEPDIRHTTVGGKSPKTSRIRSRQMRSPITKNIPESDPPGDELEALERAKAEQDQIKKQLEAEERKAELLLLRQTNAEQKRRLAALQKKNKLVEKRLHEPLDTEETEMHRERDTGLHMLREDMPGPSQDNRYSYREEEPQHRPVMGETSQRPHENICSRSDRHRIDRPMADMQGERRHTQHDDEPWARREKDREGDSEELRNLDDMVYACLKYSFADSTFRNLTTMRKKKQTTFETETVRQRKLHQQLLQKKERLHKQITEKRGRLAFRMEQSTTKNKSERGNC